MNLLVFGLGYSARATVQNLTELYPDTEVWGTTRSTSLSARYPRRLLFAGDQASAEVSKILRQGTSHILGSIAPDAEGDPALRHHRDDILRAPGLAWLGYFSTVGVYGDHNGAWIDESAALAPKNERSAWRVRAEAQWQALADEKGVPLFILRLAGIYGPGRSGFDKLRAGTAQRIVKPGQVFNRIHVDDIGRVTALAAERKLAGVFNLADDEPAPPQDVVTYAAQMIGVTPPPEQDFASAAMSPMARSFYSDNKRVSNAAIKSALGIALKYPSYREGLAAIRAEEENQ